MQLDIELALRAAKYLGGYALAWGMLLLLIGCPVLMLSGLGRLIVR